MTETPTAKTRSQGQWAVDGREPLNANEVLKQQDDGLNVRERVESIYAALQAGGVATMNPTTAPAGDEILRSAGFADATPNPTIADLNRQPVQEQQMPVNTNPEQPALPDQGQPQQAPMQAEPQPATGMDGVRQGIETPAQD